jgi:hypothetical protein
MRVGAGKTKKKRCYILFQFGHRDRRQLWLPGCTVLTFLCKRIPDVRSSREFRRRGVPVSFTHRTFPCNSCPGLSGVLLRLDDAQTGAEDIPLVQYAGDYWYQHAQIGNVELHIKDAMDHFFDMDKPHFSAWIRIQGPYSQLRHFPVRKDISVGSLILRRILWTPWTSGTLDGQASAASKSVGVVELVLRYMRRCLGGISMLPSCCSHMAPT